MRRIVAVVITVPLLSVALLSQNNVVGWSAFDMGYAASTSGSAQVRAIVGQVVVGTSLSSGERVESGFIVPTTATSGYPPNSGTFTVTTTSDSGQGSLRMAMQTANTTPGVNIITFNIPGSGVHTITPLSALPDITDPVFVDGYSQPGSHPNTNGPGLGNNAVLLIEIDGTNVNPSLGGNCFLIRGGNSTIRGLVINRTRNAGIMMIYGSNNVIEGNFIGTDPTGTVAMGNVYGVLVETDGTNYRIGGTTPAARNVISGNSFVGIGFGILAAGGSHHAVQGNLIGTNAAGTSALPNGTGISLAFNVNSVLIGGSSTSARNVISGNGTGIAISSGLGSPQVSHNRVEGNFIGTDVTGTVALGNAQNGIAISGTSNTVGGTMPGSGNIISGNGGSGVYIFSADSSIVQGNHIGTDVTGSLPVGNHDGGIYLVGSDLTIGGTEPGAGNTIMFNGASPSQQGGIAVIGASQRDAILGNSIYANQGLGIDLGGGLGPNGVTPNDSCDVDTLVVNNYQNFPVLASAVPVVGNTIVQGTLNSRPNSLFRIEFFASPAPDSTMYGEGKSYLGFASVMTGNSCVAAFADTLSIIPLGSYISATATDIRGNTSEFSRCIAVGTTSVRGRGGELPQEFSLSQNYPNPFNPSTTIRFGLPHDSPVTLTVYNTLGEEVTQLVHEHLQAGYHDIVFRGDNLASGVYFYRLNAGSFTSVKKLLLLK